jgi:hypothetical protein
MAIALVLVVVASAAICYSVAKKKNLNAATWVALAVVFGPLAIPFVLFWKPRT